MSVAGPLIALFLAAPPSGMQWSAAVGVGVWFPRTWQVTARDKGDRLFVVEGPRLGPGRPRLVLWSAGGADRIGLDGMATRLAKQVSSRPGWRVAARQRKRIGPWPAVRLGLRFLHDGEKGRARFTVALLGAHYFVLELSAAASHFPGSVFDRIEQSLAVRWSDETLEPGLVVPVPRGWEVLRDGPGTLRLRGPALGRGPLILTLRRERGGPVPPGAKAGPELRFLGAKRPSHLEERVVEEHRLRLLVVRAEAGVSAGVMMPAASWDDLFPVSRRILEGLKRAPAPKGG